jgi:hypothetical protein
MEEAGGVAGIPKRMPESARRFKPIFLRALAEQWEAAKGRQRAAELGAKIQAENGLGNAMAFIDEHVRATAAALARCRRLLMFEAVDAMG